MRDSAYFANFSAIISRILAMAHYDALKRRFRQRLGTLVGKNGTQNRLSANEFAKRCRLTSSRRVTDWLGDGPLMPSAENLTRISDALGVSVDWLLGYDVPKMRGATTEKANLADELALHAEHAIAVNIRGQPYATHVATHVVDGEKLLEDAVARQLAVIDDAWRQASMYTKSGISLLTEGSVTLTGQKTAHPILTHLTFQAAIFSEALKRGTHILRSASKRDKQRRSRPLLALLRGASVVDMRKK